MPDCETENGCIIPPLGPMGERALALRDKLVRLGNLHIGDAILRIYGADPDDLELLAIAEDELRETNNGPGSEMVTEREG